MDIIIDNNIIRKENIKIISLSPDMYTPINIATLM